MNTVKFQWRVLIVLGLVALLAVVGCTDPTPTPAPTTAPMVAATVIPTVVPTKAASTTANTGTPANNDPVWMFQVTPGMEEQKVKVDPNAGTGTILWLKQRSLYSDQNLYLAGPILAEGATLRAAASNPYTLAIAITALGLYELSKLQPNGSWSTYNTNMPSINLTPLLPASLRALMNASTGYNVTIGGKSVAMTRPYVSPDAAYTVVAKGQTVLVSWQAIKTLAEAQPSGGITFKTGVGDVVAQLTKVGAGKPPNQCSWYWTVTVPGLKFPVTICFDDLLPFIESIKNGNLPPGLSMVTPQYFALPA